MSTNTANSLEKEYKINFFHRSLCYIAGSDLNILKKCPHEIIKHSCIGLIILSTAFLAGFAMSFLVELMSDNIVVYGLAGFIWGIMILNLDRFIVASYKKQENKENEFKIILPRLIIATIIGATISIPIELEFFKEDIDSKVDKIRYERIKDFNRSSIENIRNAIKSLNMNIAKEEKFRDTLISKRGRSETIINNDYIDSSNRIIRRSRIISDKSFYNSKISKVEKNIENYEKQIKEKEDTIKKIETFIYVPISIKSNNGFLIRIKALHALLIENNYVLLTYLIFLAILIGFEVAPIMTKFFTPISAYDRILIGLENSAQEYRYIIEQEAINIRKKEEIKLKGLLNLEESLIEINNKALVDAQELTNKQFIQDEINILKNLGEYRLNKQEYLNQTLIDEAAMAQEEIGREAIRIWKEKHLKDLSLNVEQFINNAPNN